VTVSIDTAFEVGHSLTVDATHLLCKHDCRGTIVGPSDPGNRETVSKSCEVSGTIAKFDLFLVHDPRVVEVSDANDRVCTKLAHRLPCFRVLAMFHEPAWRFGAKKDTHSEDESWDESRAELQTPSDSANVFHHAIGAKSEEDAFELCD